MLTLVRRTSGQCPTFRRGWYWQMRFGGGGGKGTKIAYTTSRSHASQSHSSTEPAVAPNQGLPASSTLAASGLEADHAEVILPSTFNSGVVSPPPPADATLFNITDRKFELDQIVDLVRNRNRPQITEKSYFHPKLNELWKQLENTSTELERAKSWSVIGVDEVGVGSWAGPLIVAAACIPLETEKLFSDTFGGPALIRDSKKLTYPQIREAAAIIEDNAKKGKLFYEVKVVTNSMLDEFGNMRRAQEEAQLEVVKAIENKLLESMWNAAVAAAAEQPEEPEPPAPNPSAAGTSNPSTGPESYRLPPAGTYDVEFEREKVRELVLMPKLLIIVDGEDLPEKLWDAYAPITLQPFVRLQYGNSFQASAPKPSGLQRTLGNVLAIPQGDRKAFSVAVASIMAKHTSLQLMEEADKKWPQYGFAQHQGYGTDEHFQAIQKHGACPYHRQCYGVMKACGKIPAEEEAKKAKGEKKTESGRPKGAQGISKKKDSPSSSTSQKKKKH
jgi:ribonuclease HII